ncbi:hypothetical protein E2C01_020773 [Portunus trituberculatus]|uniref:Uncharacterized protein n=1 Tax=Portunus trituberculatus TaxID=210409 RepID=A0A5B7E130_PORTR|nr:hypothetical protein [Portunus trituberculatus]
METWRQDTMSPTRTLYNTTRLHRVHPEAPLRPGTITILSNKCKSRSEAGNACVPCNSQPDGERCTQAPQVILLLMNISTVKGKHHTILQHHTSQVPGNGKDMTEVI